MKKIRSSLSSADSPIIQKAKEIIEEELKKIDVESMDANEVCMV